MVQRELSGKRADEIFTYLTKRPDRFFNSLVIAFHDGPPTWFSGSVIPQKLSRNQNTFDVEDIRESGAQFGVLQFTGTEKMFALDGQHRLSGIKIAKKKNALSANDCVPVIFVGHSHTEAGIRRSREIFTTLNKEAKKVGVGDIIALDENDPAAIITRMIVEGKSGLSGKKVAYKQTESINPKNDLECVTTIANIYYSALNLISVFHFKNLSRKEVAALPRPDNKEIKQLYNLAQRFFTKTGKCFPEFGKVIDATVGVAEIIAENRNDAGGHLLFRPVGITILTKLVCDVKEQRQALSLEQCIEVVSKIPVKLDKTPFRNVLWIPRNSKMSPQGKNIIIDLLREALGLPKGKSYDISAREYEELTGEEWDSAKV